MTTTTDTIESHKMRLQMAREALARKSTTPAERRDLIAEIEWWESRITLANSVGVERV